MIALDSNRSLQILLGAAIATSQLPFTATYVDYTALPSPAYSSKPTDGQTNSTTAVDLVAAPAAGTERTIKRANVFNADTLAALVTVRINSSGTPRTVLITLLAPGERLEYEDTLGWRVIAADGGVRVPGSVPVTVTSLKNKVINGDFGIWQRGTSLAASAGQRYLADRWGTGSNGTTVAPSRQAFALGQTDVPGFPDYYHRSVVASAAGAGNFALMYQAIENVAATAGTITVSFWAKADAAKPMSVELVQNFGTGGSPGVTGIGVTKVNLTTTWQRFTVTAAIPSIAGKTAGAGNNVQLTFWFDAGSTYSARSGALGQQSGTFDIAQVQLEAGAAATTFEQRPPQIEFALCQRYFEKSYSLGVSPGAASDANGISQAYATGLSSVAHRSGASLRFNVAKRATPAVTLYSPETGAAGVCRNFAGGADILAAAFPNDGGFRWNTIVDSAAASEYNLGVHWAADAEI